MIRNPVSIPPVPTEEGGELKPCPFCGSRGEELGLNRPDELHGWFIRCYGCNIETAEEYTREEVVAAWNTRPTQARQDVAGLVEGIARIIADLRKPGGRSTVEEDRAAQRILSALRPSPISHETWDTGKCFECGHDLHAPFCPACNPEMGGQSRQEGKQP